MARHQQFGGFGGGDNMQQLMRQAQKLQEQMTKAQEDIEAREFSAQAGGGMVSVTVNGKHEVTGIQIKPECVDPEDVEMLQDMVMAAGTYSHPSRRTPFDEQSPEYRERVRQELKHGRTRGDR